MSSEPAQAAGLIASIRRRTIEGTSAMRVLNNQLAALRLHGLTAKQTHNGHPWTPAR